MPARDTDESIWQALLAGAGREPRPHWELDAGVLAPLQRLLGLLGEPQQRLRFIHVAGSKGKGSTVVYLERLLGEAGVRFGAFSSPHLEHWRERFRVQGVPADTAAIAGAYARLRHALAAHPAPAAVRFFDRLTALALCLFEQAGCDWVALETGIGGRVDATSVVAPALSIITHIEREHCAVLGDSLAQIAREKAGIVKPATPVVSAVQAPAAARVIADRARVCRSELLRAGTAFRYQTRRAGALRQRVRFRGARVRGEFVLPTPAAVQAENAALALAACERLALLANRVPAAAFAEPVPGRCEMRPGCPPLLLDAAHTPASFDNLLATLRTLAPARLHLLVACSSDRHLPALAGRLAARAVRVVATDAGDASLLPATVTAAAFRAARPALAVAARSDLAAALALARHGLGAPDLVCVTGSAYLVGHLRRALARETPPRAAR